MSKKRIPNKQKKEGPSNKRISQVVQFFLFTLSVLFCCVLFNVANQNNKDVEEEIVAYHVIGATDTPVTTTSAPTSYKQTLVSEEKLQDDSEHCETQENNGESDTVTSVPTDSEYTSEDTRLVSEKIKIRNSEEEEFLYENDSEEEIEPEFFEDELFQNEFPEDILFSTYYTLDSNVCEECKEVMSDVYEPSELENMQFTHDYIMADYSDITLSDDEIDIICNVIYHEAGLECFAGKVCIANIILNRIKNENFDSDSVTELICKEGQFNPEYAYIDHENFVPEEDCYEALMVALEGYDYSEGTVYYCRLDVLPEGSVKNWFLSLEKCKDVGHHSFYFEEEWD